MNITSHKNNEEYLSLIYLQGVWVEEKYLSEIKDPNQDIYNSLSEGEFELK